MVANYTELAELMRQQYGSAYTNKIDHLERLLTEYNEIGRGKFVVLPLEAGIGKSLETDRIIGEYVAQGGYRRYLLVKQFTEDVRASVERINSYQHDCFIPHAIGITAENWSEYRDQPATIADYRVVVITHQRYLQLRSNTIMRSYFEARRDTLIIDEALSMDVAIYSDELYRKMHGILPTPMYPMMSNVCSGLVSELSRLDQQSHGNRLVTCRPTISNLQDLDEFAAFVEANKRNIPFQAIGDVENFIHSLRVLYQNTCLYNNGRISAVDPSLRPWTLGNNIVLDATGIIDRRYKWNEMVAVDRQTPIIDHSSWALHQVDFNSSISGIRRAENYHLQLVSKILEHHRPGDKTLVITRSMFESRLNELIAKSGLSSHITVTHLGNIIGKNDWRGYTQVWIAAMPNIPMEIYVLWWSMATGKHFSERHLKMVAVKGTKGRFTFEDPQVESIRFGCVVAEMYQAIKRINRDNTQEAEVFVVTADDKLVSELQTQLRGIRLGEIIHLDIQQRKSEESSSIYRADRLVNHLRSLPPGAYSKREIREAVGIDASNFAKCLRDANIVQLQNAGAIRISTRKIEIMPGRLTY